ncbi:cyclin-dependent kinase 11B isoform X2 [Aethina tumida]|uniref:cyclin-dependent kinase 11B isoform X2 n=1 Tax=Aethina tumida TaxID=116153 RepID=UPI002148F7A9|nr:cyclin-dependent kinase 11B isoform X2 [Aethina tumida]
MSLNTRHNEDRRFEGNTDFTYEPILRLTSEIALAPSPQFETINFSDSDGDLDIRPPQPKPDFHLRNSQNRRQKHCRTSKHDCRDRHRNAYKPYAMEHNSKNRHRHSDPDKYTDGKRDRNDKYKERADRALRDLRERLLNKRSRKGHKSKERDSEVSKKVEQEHSEVYIKEIIKISADRQRTTSTGHRTVYIEHNDDKCVEKDNPQPKAHTKEPKRPPEVVTVSDDSDNRNSAQKNQENSPYFVRVTPESPSPTASCDSDRLVKLTVESNNGGSSSECSTLVDADLPSYYPAIQGCRSVEEFQCLNRIEEGTYGVVYRAKDRRTNEIVALKRLKMEKEKEGFPITSLREINTLLKSQHPNIVTVREIVVGSNMDKIFIVMDYVEHDLKSLMETMRLKKQSFQIAEVKCLLRQLLIAISHLHDNWILHRDLKTSNLLLSHKGILKVGDFGLAREYGSPLKAYTPVVVTLWYRAPELLLCTKEYSTPIDMWSVGCIFAELLLMNTLFPGKSEADQLNRVFKDLGTPSEKIWPGFNNLPAVKKIKLKEYPTSDLKAKFTGLSDTGLDLLTKFLTYDPAQRIAADESLNHGYFKEMPLPIEPEMFPTWPAKSELGQKRALAAASPKPPSGGGEYKRLKGDDENYGFRLAAKVDLIKTGFNLKF